MKKQEYTISKLDFLEWKREAMTIRNLASMKKQEYTISKLDFLEWKREAMTIRNLASMHRRIINTTICKEGCLPYNGSSFVFAIGYNRTPPQRIKLAYVNTLGIANPKGWALVTTYQLHTTRCPKYGTRLTQPRKQEKIICDICTKPCLRLYTILSYGDEYA